MRQQVNVALAMRQLNDMIKLSADAICHFTQYSVTLETDKHFCPKLNLQLRHEAIYQTPSSVVIHLIC